MDDTLKKYLDDEGRVTRWPGQKHHRDKIIILDYLASKFAIGIEYSEHEVNVILKQHHTFDDWALLRRELFERGDLNRDKAGKSYWRTPDTKLY